MQRAPVGAYQHHCNVVFRQILRITLRDFPQQRFRQLLRLDVAQKTRDPQSPVMKANLLRTCRQCHAGATDNFPGAWLSHYDPGLHKAPMVYAVKVGYAVLIPFMIGGLGLQILLHLWRLMANR